MGAELVNARLPKGARVVIKRLTKKTEPEGAGQETSRPLLSVRKFPQPGINSTRARPRWLTERTASWSSDSGRIRFIQRKRRIGSADADGSEELRQTVLRKSGQ